MYEIFDGRDESEVKEDDGVNGNGDGFGSDDSVVEVPHPESVFSVSKLS